MYFFYLLFLLNLESFQFIFFYIFLPHFSSCVLASFLPSIFLVSPPLLVFFLLYIRTHFFSPFLYSLSTSRFFCHFSFFSFFSPLSPLLLLFYIYFYFFHARFPRLFGINCSGICFVFFYLSFLYLYLSSFQFLNLIFFHFYFLPSLFSHSLFLLSPLLLNHLLLYILSTFLFCSSLLPHPFCSFIYSFHFLFLSLYIFFPFSLSFSSLFSHSLPTSS